MSVLLLRYSFLRNSFIYIAGTIATGVLNYVFQIVVSHKLSVTYYGELQTLFALFAILAVLTAGIQYYVLTYASVFSRHADYDAARSFSKDLKTYARTFSFATAVLLSVVSVAAYFYLHLSSPWSLVLIVVTVIISSFTSFGTGLLSGFEGFWQVNVSAFVGSATKLVVGMVSVLILPHSLLVVSSLLISSVASYIVTRHYVRTLLARGSGTTVPWRETYFQNRSLRTNVVPIFLFALGCTLIGNIDLLIVRNVTTPEITGYYSVLKVLGSIILTINAAIIAVIVPRACGLDHTKERLNRGLVYGAYGLIGLVSASSTAVFFIFPRLIISTLFGAKYLMFSHELWIFGLIAFALSLYLLEANIAYARQDFRMLYSMLLIAVLLTLGVHVYSYSVRLIAFSIAAAYGIGYISLLGLTMRRRKHVGPAVSPVISFSE